MSEHQREIRRCAIWARVSTSDQHTANQLADLRAWASKRGLDIAAEYVTEDSAWQSGNGNGKGAEFDRQRAALLAGATRGDYDVVLCWAVDRLSRRGGEDTMAFVRRLTETGCALWADKDPWVQSVTDPMVRELLLGMFGTFARWESERRSQRIKAGLAQRKAEGKPVGRQPGVRDKKPRRRSGYVARWERERAAAAAK